MNNLLNGKKEELSAHQTETRAKLDELTSLNIELLPKDNSHLWLEESRLKGHEILSIYTRRFDKKKEEEKDMRNMNHQDYAASVAQGISGDGEYSLKGRVKDFIKKTLKKNESEWSRNIFVPVDNHWIVVHLKRLDRENKKIGYAVADSLSEGAEVRSQKIHELLTSMPDISIRKANFSSKEQRNSHDCGIYAALNAVDMNTNNPVKSKFSQDDVDMARKQIEEQREEGSERKEGPHLWLEEFEILDIYRENGGIETKEHAVSFAKDISGSGNSLEDHFRDFKSNGTERSRNVFVMVNDHWISVRLEKTTSKETSEEGITYQVADSLWGDGAKARSQKIDELFNYKGIKRVPFNSEKQRNGYDCGIYAALNAIDMHNNWHESTFSKKNADGVRWQIEETRREAQTEARREAQREREELKKFKRDMQRALLMSMQEPSQPNIEAINSGESNIGTGQAQELNSQQNRQNNPSPDRSEGSAKGGRYR